MSTKEQEIRHFFPSTNEHCPNSLSKEHKKVHNARETHFVCGHCSRILGEIPENEKRIIPAWKRVEG